jgi:hypothetical protein
MSWSGLLLLVGILLGVAVAAATSESAPTRSDRMRVPGTLPPTVDLRPGFANLALVTRPQGARGTCSVFTVVGALEYAAAVRFGRGEALSVEFLNWAAHRAVGRKADGGFFHELWKGYQASGICAESRLPYQSAYDAALDPSPEVLADARNRRDLGLRLHWVKEWDPNTGLTDVEFEAVKRTLAAGWPVCGGFRWPKNARWNGGVLEMCGPEDVFDGHSVLLVGYRDDAKLPGGGVFLIRNSDGDERDAAMPYQYVRAYMNDAAWIESPSKRPQRSLRSSR